MINQYKRLDVFSCNYESHAKFENKVSVYHVLKVKKCYPQGCIYFKWKCKLINKGKRCIKGYNYIGKNCFGCSYYYDIKVHSQPIIKLSQEKYQEFLEELQLFEDWLDEVVNNTVNFWGKIDVVKPRFSKMASSARNNLNLNGFTLIFREAYFDNTHFNDLCYAVISPERQQRLKFAAGDEVEFRATVELDRGRILLKRLRNVDFINRAQNHVWTYSDALVAKRTATFFEKQPAKCLTCAYGVLIDVYDQSHTKHTKRRELFCLKGVKDPELCCYLLPIETMAEEYNCPKRIILLKNNPSKD